MRVGTIAGGRGMERGIPRKMSVKTESESVIPNIIF